jgi:hypothetical protein
MLFRGRGWAALLALVVTIGVLAAPSTSAGATNPIYSPTPDPGTVPISYTVNTIAHMQVKAAEAKAWPPVIGQADFVRWDINLQEDITSGKVVVDFKGPNNVTTSFSYPVCGGAGSAGAVIPAHGPNVTPGPFFVWPVSTRTTSVPCPIKAGEYDTGLVPFAISSAVQPGTYQGTIQVADQTGGVILKTSWQIVLKSSGQGNNAQG